MVSLYFPLYLILSDPHPSTQGLLIPVWSTLASWGLGGQEVGWEGPGVVTGLGSSWSWGAGPGLCQPWS